MHFTDNQKLYTLPLLLRLVHTHNENAKSSNFNRNYFMGATSIQRKYIFDFRGGATTALRGATIAD